jgi:hypothetical protein
MPGYDHYRDRNGVTWKVITHEDGFALLGTVPDDADPKYDPPAEDLQAEMAKGGLQLGPLDIIHTDPPTDEQTRTLFTELARKIEAYAKTYAGHVSVRVTASRSVSPLLVLGLLIGIGLVLDDDRA